MNINQEQIKHLLTGAAFFSTGGGGSLTEGLKVIQGIEEITLLNVDLAHPDKFCATAYLVGGVSPPSLEIVSKYKKIVYNNPVDIVVKSFNYLQKIIDKKIDYVVPIELGGFNTAVSLYLAAKTGVPLIDADLTGRSAPEMLQTSYYLGDIDPSPAAVITIFDDKFLIENVSDYVRMDEIFRSIVALSANYDIGVSNFPIPLKKARPYLLENTLSHCIEIGALLAENKVMDAIKCAKGKVIFTGILKEEIFEEKNGFTIGKAILENNDQQLVVEYKNENLVSYSKDKQIIASVPDLIGVITINGKPVMNTDYPKHQPLIVYSIPSPQIWKSAKGQAIFGLKHFGYN